MHLHLRIHVCVRVSARTHLHLYTCARVCVYHLSVLLILFPCSQWSAMSSSSCTTPTPLATRALTTPKVGWGGRWGVQISYRRISQNNHPKPNKNENSRQTKPYTGPVWLLDDPQQPNDGQKLIKSSDQEALPLTGQMNHITCMGSDILIS